MRKVTLVGQLLWIILDKLTSRYGLIIGRDLMSEVGMAFCFDTLLMEWDNVTTPMIDHMYVL